ncbi:Uncharacterised protein [uncultured archaeon]|nr:Uncharacterised protein [uncultured archaeon]
MKTTTNFRNTTIVVFALLLMALAASAFNINDYMASTESPASVSQSAVTVSGVSYTVYSLAGKDSIITKGDAIVKDKSEMSLVLKAKCFDTSYPTSTELNEINSYVLAFNESRQMATSFGGLESFCDSIIGQASGDEGDCVDLTSCQIACNMGSYSCMQYAQGSATFLPELMNYANVKRSIDRSVNDVLAVSAEFKGVSSASQLSFSVSEKVGKIAADVSTLQNESANYAANKLFTRPIFEFCVPVGATLTLNNSVLSSAATKAAVLSVKAGCFDDLSARTDALFNDTFARIDLYTNTKAKGTIQEEFNTLASRYNLLVERADAATAMIEDAQLPQYITDVEALNAKYYQYVHDSQYDQAGLTVGQISSKLDEFESRLDATYVDFGPLIQNKTDALTKLDRADAIIEDADVTMSADLSRLRDRYTAISIALSAKITPEEAPAYAAQYEDIATQASALIEKKRQLEAERVPQLLSDTMRGISMTVLNSVSGPLGVKETDKRAWIANVPIIVIVFVDILILAAFSAAFFFLVLRSTKEFMKPKVMQSWGIIGIVLLLLLAGLSYALYSSLVAETSSASSFAFMKQAKAQTAVSLFVERLSADDATAIDSCSAKVESALQAAGIAVSKTEIIDGVCSDRPLADCLSDTQVPMVRLKFSNANSTAFYTFYRTEAIASGDAQYFDECTISQLIE